MNPYYSLAGMFAVLLAMTALLMVRNNKRRRKQFIERLRKNWGTISQREYTPDELNYISHYACRKEEEAEFFIDDITWNDLDMDRVFVRINQTVSSPGEDYLYYLLRTPRLEEEALRKQEELVAFFAEESKKREELQILLAEVGKGRYGSVSDAIFLLEDAPVLRLAPHVGAALLALALLIYLIFRPVPGILLFLVACTVNATTYYSGKDRKITGIYLYCFENLLRMLSAARKMEKIDWPQTRTQMEAMKKARKSFDAFQRGAFLVTGKSEGGGSPLSFVMDYVRMIAHVDLLKYNSMLREVKAHKKEVMVLLDSMGELDAAMSIASFRLTLPYYSKPEFTRGTPTALRTENLYHPLIADAVANSIQVSRGALVTGSNASGKSTFLKNLAVNAILAQSICTCTATAYQAPMFRILTSMALRDDLFRGESYFIVEIKSLKRILEEAGKGEPMLCIVDEVLRGTNTVERIAASSRILKELAKPHVLCFAATHDIELSYILEAFYENYHFEEEIRDKDVLFNYLLQEGRATTRNAIRLLQMLEYDENIVREASASARHFEEAGVWEKLS